MLTSPSSVVQRQLWLMQNKKLPKAAAYDAARKEFYHYRHLEELQRRVAKEEALHVGAYFGPGPLEVGMQLEDRAWEGWKEGAAKQIEDEQQMRAQMFSGSQPAEPELSEAEFNNALEEVQDSVPQSREGQKALGGAALHP